VVGDFGNNSLIIEVVDVCVLYAQQISLSREREKEERTEH
jgi:hypothetical protein